MNKGSKSYNQWLIEEYQAKYDNMPKTTRKEYQEKYNMKLRGLLNSTKESLYKPIHNGKFDPNDDKLD